MSEQVKRGPVLSILQRVLLAAAFCFAIAALARPGATAETLLFVLTSLLAIAPLVIPGILLAAWIIASGADSRIALVFEGRMGRSILAASVIGAITPVCGVTVLPLMAGLLAGGVPLAPVMAFWLASPVTDPAMLATTAATLGAGFAIGKTLAAFALGILGGVVTLLFIGSDWVAEPLRENSFVRSLRTRCCRSVQGFHPAVWSNATRRRIFARQLWVTTRLILICLVPAFAAEHLLNQILQPEALTAYVGHESQWAIPLAVFVGAPAYVDGYAALPLTRALIDHGMSQGAAMAFLVSGGVVSIWGAMAVFPVLRLMPFLLYLLLAVTGSLLAGYGFEAVSMAL